jgi:hypothetical protein
MPGKITVTRRADAPSPGVDPARLAAVLKRGDGSFVARWIILAILGFVVLWIGPFIAATIAYVLRMRDNYTPWLTCFFWSCLIGLPILFFFEWLTRGKFLDNTMEGLGDIRGYGMYGGAGMTSAFYLRGRIAAGALAVEICLWGPRMVIAGFRRIAALMRVKPKDHAPAAAVLAPLMRQEEGLSTGAAMTQARLDPDDFSAALAYLSFHEIVGMAKDGSRIWVLSDARKKLAAAMAR